jgi:hypothetical protein
MNLLSIINLLLSYIYYSITLSNHDLIELNGLVSTIYLHVHDFVISIYLILLISYIIIY